MADSGSNLHPTLQQCHALIKAGDRSGASQLLKPYLSQNPRDADAWWLMAYTVTDVGTRIKCVERVIAINPEYPKAQETLAKLRPRLQPAEPPAPDSIEASSAETPAPPPAPVPVRRASPSPFTVDISEDEPPAIDDAVDDLEEPDDSFFR